MFCSAPLLLLRIILSISLGSFFLKSHIEGSNRVEACSVRLSTVQCNTAEVLPLSTLLCHLNLQYLVLLQFNHRIPCSARIDHRVPKDFSSVFFGCWLTIAGSNGPLVYRLLNHSSRGPKIGCVCALDQNFLVRKATEDRLGGRIQNGPIAGIGADQIAGDLRIIGQGFEKVRHGGISRDASRILCKGVDYHDGLCRTGPCQFLCGCVVYTRCRRYKNTHSIASNVFCQGR
mmetsp:Transcript_19827/g.43018  ORF Transcript_19827/g.43018 Transcript_19827/m.43018 type:complete len:231 (+) Transcript_19827:13-705(+)